ncbi:serine hydrolase domain-containing protein [Streptomyces sp. IMTB 1903]|uniref:serine hydrolase domain-containing protein n=1 Tax=Streptomyces sp. IMTB 1903 TaxID=1776680 RepID=UPI00075340EF|nr:serine hydrolase domain-containing protein [Streptomyces sp. IMTB 1903]
MTTPSTARIEDLLQTGARKEVYPGAVWAVGDADGIRASGSVSVPDPDRPDEPMRLDTVFDVASLTKILAVWATIGTLVEEGKLQLHTPLGTIWDEVAGHPLARATAHHLLTHTAGLPLRANLKNLYGTDPQDIRDGVLHEALHRPPGEAVEYTDRAALILGYLAEHLSGQPLDQLTTDRIWHPLGMTRTRFGPLPSTEAAHCAPTEYDETTGTHLKGTAHDFSARLLGGVCGIAGTFSVLDDLALFLRHMLAPTQAALGPTWIKESLRIHTGTLTPARGLFWHPAPGTDPAKDVWVHYGFTGTGMWISPAQSCWAVLLTNKVYFTRDRGPLTEIRNRFRATLFA